MQQDRERQTLRARGRSDERTNFACRVFLLERWMVLIGADAYGDGVAAPWPRGGAEVNSGETVDGRRTQSLSAHPMIARWFPRRCPDGHRAAGQLRVDDVRVDVVRLASLTLDAIAPAPRPCSRATSGADRVVADDDAVDRCATRSRTSASASSALGGIALPDVRFVAMAMRVAHELERSADLMVNVAKSTCRLFPRRLDATAGRSSTGSAGRRRSSSGWRSTPSPTAIRRGPPALADMDDTIDELEKRLFRHVLEVGAATTTTTGR